MELKDAGFKGMIIPRRINIGGVDYSVMYFNSNCVEDRAMGRSDGKNAEIHICSDMNETAQNKTFIHESLHAIIAQYAVDIPEDQEEKIVSQLTTGVYDLVKSMIRES